MWVDLIGQGIPETFLDTQAWYVKLWLLNPLLYVVVAALLLLSFLRPAMAWSRQFLPSFAQDAVYLVVRAFVVLPVLACAIWVVHAATTTYMPWIQIDALHGLPILAQILLAFVARDFLQYVSHFLRHKIRWMWYFHTIHHSQEHLNPLTTKRNHLFEDIFTTIVISWVPLAILGSPVETWWLFYAIDGGWDYMVHSNLRLPFGPLRYVVVTPEYHRIHHSKLPQHYDKNFSVRLVLWDVVFGTACFDFDEEVETGVPDDRFVHERDAHPWSLVRTWALQWIYPFRKIAADLRSETRTRPST